MRAAVAGDSRRKGAAGRPLAVRCLALSLLATGIATATIAGAADRAVTHRIVIEGLNYLPETLVVHRGDTVVWINKDPFPHTVTAPAAFDSGSLGAGKSWRFVARRAGVFPYVCTLHSNMTGTLRVE